MGLNSVKNLNNRLFWKIFIGKSDCELRNAGICEITFDEFKNDGSYAKAKTGREGTKWVYAKDSSRRWVELELKAKRLNGAMQSQNELYKIIKKNIQTQKRNSLKITWDEEDRLSVNRKSDGGDLRIKVYLADFDDKKWISTMVLFIQEMQPMLMGKH
ncbi:hypothetical protein ACUUL3_10965 [Thiovibrio sp. JS02]